jgi:hypothetical protein
MKVTLTKTTQNPPEIRPASVRRDWMDGTHNKHAYRCLPLTEANTSGWEMLLPHDVIFQWDGGSSVPRVISGGTINHSINGHSYEYRLVQQSIIGMASFTVGWTFQTPPGIWTWISGSPNYFVDGAVPLSASIPSDWWPDEVNMSWSITKVGEPVIFPAGSPFMFFTFYNRSLIGDTEFEVENLWDKPELTQQRAAYHEAKRKNQEQDPWRWTNGIRTGLDEKGNAIGPKYDGHLELRSPYEKS